MTLEDDLNQLSNHLGIKTWIFFAGKGAFCLRITEEEHKLLTDNGIKVNKKPDY